MTSSEAAELALTARAQAKIASTEKVRAVLLELARKYEAIAKQQ